MSQRLVDNDLFGHLTFGHAAVLAGHVLKEDPYTFVPHAPVWYNHEWLWETCSWLLYSAGGDRALLLAKALCGAIALAFLALLGCRRQADPVVLLVVLALAAQAMAPDVHVRPYMATYALFPVCLYLLERVGDSRWAVPSLLVLFVVWANTHAAFVVGLGTVVIYAIVAFLEKRPVWRRYAEVAGASTLLVCLNPYGPAYWPFVLRAVTMRRSFITEFQAVPWAVPPQYDPFFWYKLLLAATVGAVIWSRLRKLGPPAWEELSLLGITGVMSLLSYRQVPLLLVTAGAYLPTLLTKCLPEPRFRHPVPIAVLAGLVWCSVVASRGLHLQVPTRPGAADFFFPYDAVRFIKANGLRGNIANHFNWGEFLIWELPDCRVSFDGRLETVYTESVIQQNLDFLFGHDPGFAARMGADMILIPLEDPPGKGPSLLVKGLMADRAHWLPVYGGSGTALFVRAGLARPNWVMPPQETDPPLVPLTGPPSVLP